jgi:hypothetical protein
MSEEIKHGHGEVEYEREDLSVRGILLSFAGMALGGVLVYLVVAGLYGYLDKYANRHQPPQNPMVQPTGTDTRETSAADTKAEIDANFPQPRLERNERVEINEFRLGEEQKLNSYGWVDEKAGVVRIPIERAMQLIAEHGLPTTPEAGVVPPSEVNGVSQAAQPSDTSDQAAHRPQGQGKRKEKQ